LRRTASGEEVALSEWSSGRWDPRDTFSIEGGARFLDFDIDVTGRVVLVWWAGGTWVNRFTMEAGWASAVEFVDDELLGRPSVDIDAQGTVWALWAGEREVALDSCEGAARNTPSGWEAPTRFDTGCLGIAGGTIAADGAGGAVAVWNQWYDSLAGTVSRAFWSRYEAGEGGWSAPEEAPLGVGAGPAVWSLSASVDGETLAIWYRAGEGDNELFGNGQFAVWTGWLHADGLWTDPERLTELGPWTTPANLFLTPPALLGHTDGSAVGAWLSYEGSREDLSITVSSAEFR
jgi:hypothetical protein